MARELAETFLISILTGIFASLFIFYFSQPTSFLNKFGNFLMILGVAFLCYGLLYWFISLGGLNKLVGWISYFMQSSTEAKFLIISIWLIIIVLLVLIGRVLILIPKTIK